MPLAHSWIEVQGLLQPPLHAGRSQSWHGEQGSGGTRADRQRVAQCPFASPSPPTCQWLWLFLTLTHSLVSLPFIQREQII